MRKSKLILLAGTAAVVAAGGALRTPVLSAQVVRCWDVVCVISSEGKMQCVETPRPCPADAQ